MNQDEIHAREKRREVLLRTTAAMAAIEESVEQILKARKDQVPYSRVDNPSMILRGILTDLFDGCWDSGYSSGEDRPAVSEGQ